MNEEPSLQGQENVLLLSIAFTVTPSICKKEISWPNIFVLQYLLTLKLAQSDIMDVINGIHFLPLDKNNYLRIQCFINLLESMFAQIKYTAFLYNDQLVWWVPLNRPFRFPSFGNATCFIPSVGVDWIKMTCRFCMPTLRQASSHPTMSKSFNQDLVLLLVPWEPLTMESGCQALFGNNLRISYAHNWKWAHVLLLGTF